MVRDMLRALTEGEKRATNLCREANVPMDRGKPLLNYLVERGLVVALEGEKGVEYRITFLGYEWLGLYERLEELLPL